jgi:hypothetical protein
MRNTVIQILNGTVTPLATVGQCKIPSRRISIRPSDGAVIAACASFGGVIQMLNGTVTVLATTAQCRNPSGVAIRPSDGVVIAACFQGSVMAIDTSCTGGFGVSEGQCQPCAAGFARQPAPVAIGTGCAPCAPGFVMASPRISASLCKAASTTQTDGPASWRSPALLAASLRPPHQRSAPIAPQDATPRSATPQPARSAQPVVQRTETQQCAARIVPRYAYGRCAIHTVRKLTAAMHRACGAHRAPGQATHRPTPGGTRNRSLLQYPMGCWYIITLLRAPTSRQGEQERT